MIRTNSERQTALKAAEEIVRAADAAQRDLTELETARLTSTIAEIEQFDADSQQRAKSGSEMLKSIGGTGPSMTRNLDGSWTQDFSGTGSGEQYLDLGSKGHGQALVKAMNDTRPMGSKGLATSGSVVVGVPLLSQSPVTLGRPLQSFLQAIPVTQRDAVYSWLAQTSRINNAAVVPEGGTKPTTRLGLVKREGRLKVIATLSEPIDKFVLEDNTALSGWVHTELTAAVLAALEAQVIAGDGEGDNLTGLANTSGVQTFTSATGDTDKLVEMRKALTKLETAGEIPSVFILSPADWEAITTKRNTNGGFDLGGAINAETRKAWGTPVALSTSLAPGSYYLLGEGAATIGRDSGIRTEWDKSQGFKTNEILARTEGRFSLDVQRPTAVLKGTFATA